ncbi:HNH endonuclease [Ancylobacter sp. SL191]|uniref:HNH endonuclease n=1 Tax=Ancylobacter sp. SL191 TaxID=2995166 RepID=UPI00226F41D2|nr:HNH endonuclease [Ancylobacter sp. SL191]WAC28784.1 HNH endonuclease [Ancylobacter sp. SL191]
MKAIFDTKPRSGYDDDLMRHYQFPRRYLSLVTQTVGDWVVLRRPRADGGNLAYFATARVTAVEPDPRSPALSFARLSDYLEFDRPVAWRREGHYAEQTLREMPTTQVGVYLRGRSVRLISEADFARLITVGLEDTLAPANASRLGIDPAYLREIRAGLVDAGPAEREWQIDQALTSRIVRDAGFRRVVIDAYEDTCAVTRLRIVNGGGRSEVQAAHVWPVAEGGPDVVQNGIALCGTVHWLFDRHLISLTDDYRLLVSHNKVPPEFRQLFGQAGDRIHLPKSPDIWPHPAYLLKHRERFAAS